MNDTRIVRGRDGAHDREHEIEGFLDRQPAFAGDAPSQVVALQELDRQVRRPVIDPKGKNLNDVRVTDARRGPPFTHETLHGQPAADDVGMQDLEGNPMPQARVFGFEDAAHASAPDASQNPVGTQTGVFSRIQHRSAPCR